MGKKFACGRDKTCILLKQCGCCHANFARQYFYCYCAFTTKCLNFTFRIRAAVKRRIWPNSWFMFRNIHLYFHYCFEVKKKKERKKGTRKADLLERTKISHILIGICSEADINRAACRYLLLYSSLFSEYLYWFLPQFH